MENRHTFVRGISKGMRTGNAQEYLPFGTLRVSSRRIRNCLRSMELLSLRKKLPILVEVSYSIHVGDCNGNSLFKFRTLDGAAITCSKLSGNSMRKAATRNGSGPTGKDRRISKLTV